MIDRDADDEALDRLLLRLGTTEPDEGFQQRMVRAVKARADVTPSKPVRTRSWIFAGALAAVAAVAVLFSIRLTHSARPTAPKDRLPAVLVERKPSQPEPGRPRTTAGRARSTGRLPTESNGFGPDLSLLASFPASPAPLTEQERLLISVANSSNPVQLAILIPEKRAAEQAAEEEAYLNFFAPPPPLPPLTETSQQP